MQIEAALVSREVLIGIYDKGKIQNEMPLDLLLLLFDIKEFQDSFQRRSQLTLSRQDYDHYRELENKCKEQYMQLGNKFNLDGDSMPFCSVTCNDILYHFFSNDFRVIGSLLLDIIENPYFERMPYGPKTIY